MNKKSSQELLETGYELAGNLTGAVVGTIVAGPVGALLGATIPTVISKVFNKISEDVLNRNISQREEQKIAAGYVFAIDRIEKNIKDGKKLRSDGFLDDGILSDSNIIFEGVIIKLQKEWELKKLQFYGNFLGNISFDQNIDFDYASVLLRTIEALSFRQLCIISIFKKKGIPQIDLYPIDNALKSSNYGGYFNYSLYSDLVEMNRLVILQKVAPFNLSATIGNCELSDIGLKLYDLMNLCEIDQKDYNTTLNDFQKLLGKNL